MAILQKEAKPFEKPVIDIDGPNGNAWVLIGHARQLARKIGLDEDVIADEMMAGDYENLLEVFDKHFGEYVDLERS